MLPRVRVLCLPDLDKTVGGVKQLYRHVEHLTALGWDAAIVTEADGFRPSWFSSTARTISFSECASRNEFDQYSTILLLPETYIGANLSDFRGQDLSTLARVIFNQNAYYSYGNFSESLKSDLESFYDSPSLLQVLSVSEDTHEFLLSNISLGDSKLSRIINAIEDIFVPDPRPSNLMHWMPRKNPQQVQAILSAIQRSSLAHSAGWIGSPLQSLSHESVAEHLNKAKIFLSFGHPEGFGLPIAEAMASGCWVIGYSGGGGRELFRYGASDIVSYGDWAAFSHSLSRVFNFFATQPREANLRLTRQSLAIRQLYSFSQERSSIEIAWKRVLSCFRDYTQSL